MNLPEVKTEGLFMVCDPHVAGTPPGQRLPGYSEQILDKLAACRDEAARLEMPFVIMGDLFHWPRDNPNSLLVSLIELFRPYRPWVLVGNHDKYQARLTPDVSVAVLEAAGCVNLLAEPGPALRLRTSSGEVVVGASPDGSPIPAQYQKSGDETVVWLTHHNINFPDYLEKHVHMRELPGVDWVINGHIHRNQPTIRKGCTRWANPGNITRLKFSRYNLDRELNAWIWRPGCEDLEPWPVPHLPFSEVFPDQELPAEPVKDEETGRSAFIEGLERLAWRRTHEAVGLHDFLKANLNPEQPESALVWELYEEVVRGDE